MSEDEPNFSPPFLFHRQAADGGVRMPGAAAPDVAPPPRAEPKALTLLPSRKDRALPPQEGLTSPPRREASGAWRKAAALVLAAGLGAGGMFWTVRHDGALELQTAQSATDGLKRIALRLDALEGRSRADDPDARKLSADVKSSLASTRDLSAAVAQLGARIDKFDQAQNVKLEKLSERIDKDALSRLADLGGRPDKRPTLEVTPAPTVPQATASVSRPPAPVAVVKADPNISLEPTGSIERPRSALVGFSVMDVRDGVALLQTHEGPQEVSAGDFLPGAGRIERIERRGRQWAVITSQGVILGP